MPNTELRKRPTRFSILHSQFSIFLLLLLGAWLVRLFALGQQSLWFDEGWSWHLAKMPLSEMALVTAGDRSPPVYYALLHFWIQLAGESEFSMRFISALADTTTVALVVAFAQAVVSGLNGRRSDLIPSPFHRLIPSSLPSPIAGLIYAVMPFSVWYAQEARMYALVGALCTASSLCLWHWIKQVRRAEGSVWRGKRWLLAAAVLLALAVYNHYYAIFLLPTQFVAVLMATGWTRGRKPITQWPIVAYSIAAAGVVLALLPWLVVASTGFAYDDGFFFPLNTLDGRLLEWLRGFASAGLARALPEGWPIALGLPAVLGSMALAANRKWRELAVMLALVIVPLLAATVAVRLVYPNRSVFHPRYLIYVAPMAAVLFGAAFVRLRAGPRPMALGLRAVAVVAMGLLGGLWLPLTYGYLTDHALQREDTRQATKHVVEALAPGDAVIMSRDNFAVRYYWPSVWRATWAADYDPASNILLAAPDGLHGILPSDVSIFAKLNGRIGGGGPLKRVRLMLWQDDVVDPQKFVESSLWPNGFELGEFNFAQIRLPLYEIDTWPLQPPNFVDNDTVLGDGLVLRSYWQRDQGYAGDWFYLVLNWQPQARMMQDYKVFVHVVDPQGKLMWQNDRLPLNALLPMTRWQPAQTYRDAHGMVIPPDTPVGRYQVIAGVYDPLTNQRLTTRDGRDHVVLGQVDVMRR